MGSAPKLSFDSESLHMPRGKESLLKCHNMSGEVLRPPYASHSRGPHFCHGLFPVCTSVHCSVGLGLTEVA